MKMTWTGKSIIKYTPYKLQFPKKHPNFLKHFFICLFTWGKEYNPMELNLILNSVRWYIKLNVKLNESSMGLNNIR